MHPIKQYCEKKGITITDLAKALDGQQGERFTLVGLSQYICGYRRPGTKRAALIAKKIKVPIEKVLFPNGNRAQE